MRITLSGAMRARDVSRPRDEQLAAAAEREARTTRAARPGGPAAPRGPGSAGPADAASARPSGANEADAPKASQAAREADGAGRNAMNGPVSPDRAADDMPSPTRRRRR
jgi:hypothetical protein